jgi:hypothetical protein
VGDDAEDRGDVDDVRFGLARQMRQEGAGAMDHAPEVDVEQPVHLRLVDLTELAEQGDARIVDDDIEAGMRRYGRVGKASDLGRGADIEAMRGELDPLLAADLGGNRPQACLVAVGQRKVAPTRGELEGERSANAAGRSRYDGGGSTDCSHCISLPSAMIDTRHQLARGAARLHIVTAILIDIVNMELHDFGRVHARRLVCRNKKAGRARRFFANMPFAVARAERGSTRA